MKGTSSGRRSSKGGHQQRHEGYKLTPGKGAPWGRTSKCMKGTSLGKGGPREPPAKASRVQAHARQEGTKRMHQQMHEGYKLRQGQVSGELTSKCMDGGAPQGGGSQACGSRHKGGVLGQGSQDVLQQQGLAGPGTACEEDTGSLPAQRIPFITPSCNTSLWNAPSLIPPHHTTPYMP